MAEIDRNFDVEAFRRRFKTLKTPMEKVQALRSITAQQHADVIGAELAEGIRRNAGRKAPAPRRMGGAGKTQQ